MELRSTRTDGKGQISEFLAIALGTMLAVKMNDRYIIYTKDLVFEDGVLYIPIYMAMFL